MKKHILIVDDEASIRELLSQFLTSRGYRVTDVDSAAEALRVVRQDAPQLLISDLQLEDSDGLVMIEQVKNILPHLPVILLTGVLFDPEVFSGNLSKLVSCYLAKTASLEQIKADVQRLLGA